MRRTASGDLDKISECLSRPRLRVVGLVIDKVDRIMHGMELGAAGMHNQVRQWTGQGFMRDLLDLLHDRGFQVYLASGHGNVIPGSDDPRGNESAVCPADLAFLMTAAGGSFDHRR